MLGDSHSKVALENELVGPGLPLNIEVAEADAEFERARTQRMGFGGWLALAWLIFAVLVAIFVPFFAKTHIGALDSNYGAFKSASHPFGANDLGQNMTVLLA